MLVHSLKSPRLESRLKDDVAVAKRVNESAELAVGIGHCHIDYRSRRLGRRRHLNLRRTDHIHCRRW